MSRLGALLSVGFKSQFPLALLWREIRFNRKSRKGILAVTLLVGAALAANPMTMVWLLAAWAGWRNLLAFADRKYPAIEV